MAEKLTEKARECMIARFGHDTLLSLATVANGLPRIRIVDSYYEDGSFYVITYALSNKMQQIAAEPNVALCEEWFTAYGVGENLGYIRDEKNAALCAKLHEVFAAWIGNGDVNEDDPNTCILRIKLTEAVLFDHGTKYEINFSL